MKSTTGWGAAGGWVSGWLRIGLWLACSALAARAAGPADVAQGVSAPVTAAAAAAAPPAAAVEPDPRLPLTPLERDWLRAHPRLRVFTKTEWAPIDLYTYEGQFRGLSGDYLRQVEHLLGVRFDFQSGQTLADGLKALSEGRTDILPSVSRTPQRESFMAFTRPYLDVPNVYVTRRGMSGVGPEAALRGLRIAVERGYAVASLVGERHPQAVVVEVDDSAAALRAVSEGEADVYLGAVPTTSFLVEKLLLANLESRGPMRSELSALHLGVRRSDVVLRSVLDKALEAIPLSERQEIHRRWTPLHTLLVEPSPPLELNAGERQFLKAMPLVRVGFEADFRPYSFAGDEGRLTGMAHDYLRLVADKLGLPLAAPVGGTWSDVFARARRGEVDMLVAVARNDEREREFAFVGPWVSTPNVLLMRRDAMPVLSLEQLNDRRVAVVKDGQTAYLMRRLYPRVALVEQPTRDDVLAAVVNGQADGGFANAALVAPRLAEGLGASLKMAGFFPELNSDLYFAVREEHAALAALLRRALASISDAERGAIAARWATVPVSLDAGADLRAMLRRLLPVLAGLLLVLTVSLGWAAWLRREVAHRRRTEAALGAERDRAHALAQARRDFLEVASHEIRTPVNAVVGALGALQDQPLPMAARELTRLARGAAQTLSEYVNNLLDLSKSDAGALRLVPQADSLPGTLHAALRTIEPSALQEGVLLTAKIDPILAPAHVFDAFRLHQVVLNLLSNAVKFGDHGRVELSALVLGEGTGGQRLCIAVEDEGIGVDPAAVARLFQPFAQAGDSVTHRRGGSGLGLVLCKRLVEAMGGTIEIAPRVPRGTRASVTLALPVAPALAPAQGAHDAPPVEAGAARVLVVEDDRVQQVLLEAMLQARGCVVDLASSAEEAQALWLRHRHPMVLTDLRLPGRDGHDLARWLRAQDGGAELCVLGCSADLDAVPEALAAGIDRLVPKPVSPEAIDVLLASWRGVAERQPGAC